jgi:DNA-binding NarL/FixJ family response regulator
VAGNTVYYGPAVSELLARWAVAPVTTADSLGRLSPRQREVLQLIAEGYSTKEIAHLLGLSISTVDTHRTELMRRLDLHDIAGVVRLAISAGLIRPA